MAIDSTNHPRAGKPNGRTGGHQAVRQMRNGPDPSTVLPSGPKVHCVQCTIALRRYLGDEDGNPDRHGAG
jgi:hypothetical protein